jgi:hypothetical protein
MGHGKFSQVIGLAVLFICGSASLVLAGDLETPPIGSSVCELARDSGRFTNVPVSIRARIRSNGIDHAFLSSPDCPGSSISLEHLGIETAPSNVGRDALFTAIFRIGGVGTTDKEVTATLVGRVTEAASGAKVATFRISDVRDMTIVWKNANASIDVGPRK